MHKFKVGDVVRLKTVKELDKEFGEWRDRFWVARSMENYYLGKYVVIKSQELLTTALEPGYRIIEDTNDFVYFEELFVDTVEELKTIVIDFSFDDLLE